MTSRIHEKTVLSVALCALALSAAWAQEAANQPPVVTRRSPVAAPAAIVEGGSSAFSVTASDSTDPAVAERGMVSVTWFADGVLRQETRTGAPGAISSGFTFRPGTNTVQGVAYRDVPVKAVALDRQGGATETQWLLRVNNLPASQTITFPQPPVKTVGDADSDLGAFCSSGLPVSYTSSAPSVATVEGGRLHVVGAGTAVLTALQTGNADFKPALPVKRTLTVKALVSAGIEPAAGGTVTGAGLYVQGSRVTLTAKPAAGYTFLHWEDGAQAPVRSLLIKGSNVVTTAFFGLTAEIAPPVLVNPGAQQAVVGVAFRLPLSFTSASLPAVTVTGLPSGLRYDAATRTILGVPLVPTRPATNGVPAETKTVTVVVRNVNPAAETQAFAMTVEPLPLWAWGEFNGFFQDEERGGGAAAMSVTSVGKIVGKFTAAATNYTFSGLSYERRDEGGSFWFAGTAVVSQVALPLKVRVSLPACAEEVGLATQTLAAAEGWLEETAEGWPVLTLYRKVWRDAGLSAALAGYTGYFTATLPGDGTFGSGYLALTVDSAGAVKTAGKLADGTAFSQSGALILDDMGRVWTVLNQAPVAYKGGALFGFAEFVKAETGGPTVLRLLDEVQLGWENRNPLAGEEYGEGFSRELGLCGGWYDKVINLRHYYTNGLTVGVSEQPTLRATVRVTDWNEAGTVKVSVLEPIVVDAACAAPDGMALAVTVSSGVGVGWAPPRAQTPSWDSEFEAYNYDELANPCAFAIAYTRATGLFKGTFNLWYDYVSAEDNTTDAQTRAHVSKSVAYEGVLTPVRADPADGVAARGFFLWPDSASYVNSLNRPVTYTYNRSFELLLLEP